MRRGGGGGGGGGWEVVARDRVDWRRRINDMRG